MRRRPQRQAPIGWWPTPSACRTASGRTDALWRFGGSVSTLRAHNATVPVALYVFGEVPDELASLCAVHDVTVHQLEPFATRLARLSPNAWPVLVGDRLLTRLLVLGELATLAPRQVLLFDQDTIVFRDVDELFAGYGHADLVAREEVHCDRSAHGIDRRMLDQPLLARLAALEGLPAVPPFDPGVMLLNHDLCARLAPLAARLVDYAWRLAVGASLRPGHPSVPTRGIDLAAMRITDDDVLRALPFPSADQRLLVDVAWWLTLAHVAGLDTDDFAPRHVAVGHEVATLGTGDDWVVGHFAADGTGRLAGWLHERVVSLA